ncbi:hypothetical protein D3C78_1702670 [compost metagenome]
MHVAAAVGQVLAPRQRGARIGGRDAFGHQADEMHERNGQAEVVGLGGSGCSHGTVMDGKG